MSDNHDSATDIQACCGNCIHCHMLAREGDRLGEANAIPVCFGAPPVAERVMVKSRITGGQPRMVIKPTRGVPTNPSDPPCGFWELREIEHHGGCDVHDQGHS